ncbi:MAG: c-type cytochrome [Dehalococcoidia bacterium]|nr:c-type cytochrome [Dehalococcoidia bacterium]
MSKLLKPVCLVLVLAATVLLWACAPTAAPSPTATKAPGAATTPGTGPQGLSPAGAKAAAEVPPPYKGMKDPFTLDDKAAIDAGAAIYKQSCIACHGEKGDGKGPAGASLKPPPVDFSTPEQQEHFEKIQDHHFWRFSEGVPGTAMPPFKGQLSEQQRWQVLTYEWNLGKQRQK